MPEDTNEFIAQDTEQTTAGMTRRSLVRTGATAAWSVPVVAAVAAAPALAISGPANLSTSTETVTSTAGATGNDDGKVSGTILLKNTNTQATTGLVITLAGATGCKFKTCTSPTAAQGWTVSGLGSATLTLTATTQLTGNSTRSLTVTTTTNGQPARSGTITMTPGATETAGVGSF